jgi:integrase
MSRSVKVPSYRLHKQSGQAVVTLADGLGRRRDVLLGRHGTPESRAEYARVIAEWEANGRRLPAPKSSAPDLSVNEMALAYWKFAEDYYGFGRRRGVAFNVRDALRILKALYGHTPAAEFGPLALKACRAEMVKKDWSRTYVNAQVDRIRRVFRWAASEQLVPASVYQALRTVEALRRGRTTARETKKVRPVSPEQVEVAIPHMPRLVRAMVEFQRLTGCRPDEVCRVRPLDLDMSNPACWVYRPGSDAGEFGQHKTAHHDQDRLVLIGPRAQEVLRPYLGTKLDAYCFDPAEGERKRSVERRASRQTPLTPSQRTRRPKPNRKRAPAGRYAVTSYRNAIYRACDRAYPLPDRLSPRRKEDGENGKGAKKESRAEWWGRLTADEREAVRAWRREHRWHPNQLRHSRATELRGYGLDVVKTILGHSKVETSQVYAEKDMQAAMELVSRIG